MNEFDSPPLSCFWRSRLAWEVEAMEERKRKENPRVKKVRGEENRNIKEFWGL